MNERENNIHLWFEMWLTKQDLGIDNIFAEDVIYTESWGPKYNNPYEHSDLPEFRDERASWF